MIKVQDIVYTVVGSPDLDKHESFLSDFGMERAARTDDRLYMRGAGKYPYIHVSQKGDPGLFEAAFRVNDQAELEEAASLPDASGIEDIDAPGGGRRVRLTGPDGFAFHLVHGIETVEEKPMRAPLAINFAREKHRLGELQRPPYEKPQINRIGHCVFKVSNAVEAAAWLQENLGMLISDRLTMPDDPEQMLGLFMRCDRGDELSDHHTVFCIHSPDDVKMHHTSYEVQDYDAVSMGHYWMKDAGDWNHEWGIGRHRLGSQVFDYWRDPWGHMYEHYADGDLLPSDWKPSDYPAVQENLAMWGPEVSPTFFD